MVMKLHSLAEASCVCSFRDDNLPRWSIEREPLMQVFAYYWNELMLNACVLGMNYCKVSEET